MFAELRTRVLSLLFFACVFLPNPAPAQRTFTEDFTTTTYRDPGPSTAVWDTVAGELRLVPFVPTTVGTIALASPAHTVAVRDGLAYVGTTGSGLQIYDVGNPAAPVFVGSYTAYANVEDIAFVGKMAVLAVGTGDLVVVDVSDPAAPSLNFVLPTGGSTLGVAADGLHVFIADGSGGLVVFSIVSGTTGNYLPSAAVLDVLVDGDQAYLALADGRVEAVDVSTPLAPLLISSISVGGSAEALVRSGDRLYVAAGTNGLRVVDITRPSSMILDGSLALAGNCVDVAVSSDVAFVAAQSGGVHQVDITDPSLPVETTVHSTAGSAQGVSGDFEHLLIADGSGGVILRQWAKEIGIMPIGGLESLSLQSPLDLIVRGDLAYLIDGTDFDVIDISNPIAPNLARTTTISGTPVSFDIAGDYAYVDRSPGGLLVLDISNPLAPSQAGTLLTYIGTRKTRAVGNRLYQVWSTGGASGGGGLRITDISAPTLPVTLADTLLTAVNGIFETLDVQGDFAYIAAGNDGLMVVDVNDATAPNVVTSYPVATGSIDDVIVDGGHAYCAAGSGGLVIYDIVSGTQVGGWVGPWSYVKIEKVGNRVLLSGSQETREVDVADPTAPQPISPASNLKGDAIALDGTRFYNLDRFGGSLTISDLVNPYWDPNKSRGRSLPFDGEDKTVAAYRLQITGSGSPVVNVSAVGSPAGNYLTSTSGFEFLSLPGKTLIWDAIFPVTTPTASVLNSITIDWLIQEPEIDRISDVPDDQGGWARLSFLPSGYDRVDTGSYPPISGYNIHRRIDNAALAERVLSAGEVVSPDGAEEILEGGARSGRLGEVLRYDGGLFLRSGAGGEGISGVSAVKATAPPGVWEVVATVYATQSAQYTVLVPTLADSSTTAAPTVYFVSAHSTTPSLFYASSPDSGYSVDNIFPVAPTGFTVHYAPSGNQLTWNASPEPDFQYYRVYRGSTADFVADAGSLVFQVAVNSWTDGATDPFTWYYRVSTVDDSGNESPAVTPAIVTDAPSPAAVTVLALHENVPNPFNPRTSIAFDLPHDGPVRLVIFNAAGRAVRTLVSEDLPAGRYSKIWDGTDDAGRSVASGVFFSRLVSVDGVLTAKMSLVR